MTRILFTMAVVSLMATFALADEPKPTTAELEWHLKYIDAAMARDQAQSQVLQVDFNALVSERVPVAAELEKRKAEAEAKAKADAEKAKAVVPPPPAPAPPAPQ